MTKMMTTLYNKSHVFFLIFLFILQHARSAPLDHHPRRAPVAKAEWWLTTADKSALLSKQKPLLTFSAKTLPSKGVPSISVDESQAFQTMDGFGFCLTGGSAMHIGQMSPSHRSALLRELFTTDARNIGTSYLRISIGASDLDAQPFTYDDLPRGETDPDLKHFSLAPSRDYLIPVLKEILKINPKLKILGSPWSAPAWMKTNEELKGGSLKTEWFDTYAKYFVKYIQEMKKEGIPIDAITIQNEPLHPGNNPSMLMVPDDQTLFIKKSLGPAFRTAGMDTKIIIYDHNADRPDYPISVLNDPEARKYVDGSAFHLYGGKISALSDVHRAHPDKNLYFTEQWVGAPGKFAENFTWHTRELIIGAVRNWCKNVLEWNLAANSRLEPHTDGGCNECLGALTIDGNTVTRNPAYYIIAQASKFVRPGSVRIQSTESDTLPNVAFRTPEGKKVLIVMNNGNVTQSFYIRHKGKALYTSLPAGGAGTFIW